jgi:hypothetical protein
MLNRNRGSSFDSFLEEEGILGDIDECVMNRINKMIEENQKIAINADEWFE